MDMPSPFRRIVAPKPGAIAQKLDINNMIESALARGKRKVTASDVAAYVQSPFYFYCEKFVDESERDESPELEMAAERGLEHEHDVIKTETEGMKAVRMEWQADPKEAFCLGMSHMAEGVQVLEQQQLFWLPEGMSGRPDMLVRQKGPSALGSHHYSVIEIKSTKDVRPEHKVQGAFYSMMLGSIQQYTPSTFTVINSEKQRMEFSVNEYEDTVVQAIAGVRKVLRGFVPRAHSGCPAPWTAYAKKVTGRQLDVALVLGIGRQRQAILEKKKIKTIHDLLAKPTIACSVKGVGRRQLEHAQCLLDGKPRRWSEMQTPLRTPTEIFLDLEGVPGNPAYVPTIYLIGMVIRDTSMRYFPFLAGSLEDERKILDDFLEVVRGIPNCTIWHWAPYDRTYLSAMARRCGVDCGDILDRMSDLHQLTTNTFVFPTTTTGLKDVAPGLGFERELQDMNADEAYLQWSKGPDNVYDILSYNRDDCEAMICVLDWMRNDGESWNGAYGVRL